jgi:DNA-binding NarL/FixJ family response regulator
VTPEPIAVAILADDLIWASRLADAVTAAGGAPRRARRAEDLAPVLEQGARFAIVDLTALAYDGVEAVASAAAAGARVVAVGQHDDLELRKRALAAGAERVYAYRKLFEAGPDVLRGWLASAVPTRAEAGTAAGAAS